MLLTGPTHPVANRFENNECLVEFDVSANIFNEEPACPEMVWNFIILWLFGVTDV